MQHKVEKVLIVTLENGEKIEITPEHPVYDKGNNKWKTMGEFEVGDLVMNSNGDAVMIVSIKEKQDSINVYNLEIKNNHNYFVSNTKILVHNKVC